MSDSNICQPHLLEDVTKDVAQCYQQTPDALWLQYHIYIPTSAAVDMSSLYIQKHNQLLA